MAAILGLLWLAGIVVSIRFIVRPSERWPFYATRGRALITAIAIFLGLPVLAAALGITKPVGRPQTSASSSAQPADTTPSSSKERIVSPTPQPSTSETPSAWTYDENQDAMRGTTTKYARTESEESFQNSLKMGDQKTVLEVQKHGGKYDVAVSNDSLQFTCNSFSGTHLSIKFDAHAVERFGCTDAKGDKFGVAFITPGGRFVNELRNAKHVIIEAEIFQRGDVQMSFNVSGLKL